jgi:hypothetical protein
MEDNVILLPMNGWDLDKLINDGEFSIIKKLIFYPQELRFTIKGMNLLEKGLHKYWNKKMSMKFKKVYFLFIFF